MERKKMEKKAKSPRYVHNQKRNLAKYHQGQLNVIKVTLSPWPLNIWTGAYLSHHKNATFRPSGDITGSLWAY